MPSAVSAFDFDATTIDGRRLSLSDYRGCVLLVVNVASRCGYTPQYAGLERLYRSYRDRGLVVLGFPSDEFGGQEPGTDAEIEAFCKEAYDVSFPLFQKTTVNGSAAHPLYQFLRSQRKGFLGTDRIKWNFTKFLIDRSGHVVARFGTSATPSAIEAAIVKLLDGEAARG
jgi:glutathione peroxidase